MATILKLSDAEIALEAHAMVMVVHCLRVAAEKFDEDALLCIRLHHPRMADSFTGQARLARSLADALEKV